jgi:hypothetical protein
MLFADVLILLAPDRVTPTSQNPRVVVYATGRLFMFQNRRKAQVCCFKIAHTPVLSPAQHDEQRSRSLLEQ